MTTQGGQVFRAPAGSWAIRFYDAAGQRRQRNGFRTRGEARSALNEELRRVRLGPVHRPEVTLDELAEAYLALYDAALATVVWMDYNLRASRQVFGRERLGELSVQQIPAWRKSLPQGRRYPAHRALRQVLAEGVRWKWIEDINNFRHRAWTPALQAAGIKHRRIYDLRHTYATWSIAAGVDIYTLSRRLGTSLQMIDRTYGHLAAGADEWERELLDGFDERGRGTNGRYTGAENETEETT